MRYLVLLCVLLFAGCESPVEPPFTISGVFDLTNAPEGSATFARISLLPWGTSYTLERYTRDEMTKTQGSFTYHGETISFDPFEGGESFECAIQNSRSFRCGDEVFVKH